MSMLRSRLGYGIPLILACALATSCQLGKNPNPNTPDGTVNAAQTPGERVKRALELGFSEADSYVQRGEFQLKNAQTGAPLAGVSVIVAGERLTSDERGVVVLPSDAAFGDKETLLAQIDAPGFVGQVVPLYPGAALKLSPVDAKRTNIGAAGGNMTNSDGSIEVVFPPGTVAVGGDIAVTRTYSETLQANVTLPKIAFSDSTEGAKTLDVDPRLLPVLGHYTYNLDLGAAKLAPGSKYSVRFKVEGPMKAVLEARMAKGDDFSTLQDLVSRDATGNIWLTMVGYAAATAEEQPQRSLMQAAGDTVRAVEADKVATAPTGPTGPVLGDWDAGYAYDPSLGSLNPPGPNTAGDPCELYDEALADVEANNRQFSNCYEDMDVGWRNANWGNRDRIATVMTHDSRYNGGGCVYFSYDPNLYVCRSDGPQAGGWTTAHHSKIYRRWWTATIHAQATWNSDDDRLKNRAIVGGKLNFSHAQAPMRTGSLGQTTDANGNAEALGVKDTYGVATISMPGMPYVYGDAVSYNVNCNTTARLSLTKNKPKIDLNTSVGGTPTSDTLAYATNKGTYRAPVARNTITLPIDLDKASEPFSINGSQQPAAGIWVDTQSTAIDAGWNTSRTLNLGIWFSKTIGTTLNYSSNDASVPQDMRPQQSGNVWNGQPAIGNITFGHPISTATNKPANRDVLTFTNVNAATTWGLNGSSGSVNASRTMGAVTLTGSASYAVAGQTVPVALNANLPEIVFTITGRGGDQGWAMDYKLTDAAGSTRTLRMNLPAPAADGKVHVWLPIEEPVGNAGVYTFQPTWIGNSDFALEAPGGGFNFPAVATNSRGTVKQYASMGSTFTTPK